MNIKEAISGRLANIITGGQFGRALEAAEIGQEGQTFFRERFWELESSLRTRDADPNSPGWEIIGGASDDLDFSRKALRVMHRIALVFYLKNPLIKRGVKIQSQYVFGQGVSTQIDNDDAHAVWNDFADDETNRREWTSATRKAALERKLQIKGNLFALFFVDRVTGSVAVREIDVDEIEEVIPDPLDGARPAFYKRVYRSRVFNPQSGVTETSDVTEFYPDWNYNPRVKWKFIGGAPVHWDRPMAHYARERISKIGIAPSEIYAQIDWAKGYSRFLEHRATVAAALSRIVLKFSSATKAGVDKAKEKLITRFAGAKGASDEVGGSSFSKDGSTVEAMNVKGATISPDEGRRLLLMVCAGFGFGETFFGDVSVGTLATAESLDQPTKLAMMECQSFWKEVDEQMARFVLLQAAKAPAHPFSRSAKVEKKHGREYVAVKGADGVYRTVGVNVEFPPITSYDETKRVTALETVSRFVPLKKLIARQMLTAIGEDDVDEALALLPDDEALTEWPTPASLAAPVAPPGLPPTPKA